MVCTSGSYGCPEAAFRPTCTHGPQCAILCNDALHGQSDGFCNTAVSAQASAHGHLRTRAIRLRGVWDSGD
eukprot:6517855-Prymnesium_polylepis.1